jgi:hypothetical protein
MTPIVLGVVALKAEDAFGEPGGILVGAAVGIIVLLAGYLHRVLGHVLVGIAQIEKNTRH